MRITHLSILVLGVILAACSSSEPPPEPTPTPHEQAAAPVWSAPLPSRDDLTLMAEEAWSDLFDNPTDEAVGAPVLAIAAARLTSSNGVSLGDLQGLDVEAEIKRLASRSFRVEGERWLAETLESGGLPANAIPAAYHRSSASRLRGAAAGSGTGLSHILLLELEGTGHPDRNQATYRLILNLVRVHDDQESLSSGRAHRIIG